MFANSFVQNHDNARQYARRGKEIDIHDLQTGDIVTVINDAIAVRKLCKETALCDWSENMIDLLGNTYKLSYVDVSRKSIRLTDATANPVTPVPYTWNFPAFALVRADSS